MASSRRTYDYKPPSFDETKDRADRQGSTFDTMLKGDVQLFKPHVGENLIRILPPSWPKASHYGLVVYAHNGVGPNDRRYLCLKENPASPYKRCPVCEELYRLGPRATQDEKNQLRPKANILYYLIDRNEEKNGVQVWMTSGKNDSEISAQSLNRRAKTVLDIVSPDKGYDVEFTRTGSGRNNTRYRGFQVMRESSPLGDSAKQEDAWLDVVFSKPLPDLLNFYPPERIEEVFYGRGKDDEGDGDRRPRRDDEEEEDRPVRPLRRTRDEEEDGESQVRSSRRGRDDEDGDEEERSARQSRSARSNQDDEEDRPARTRPSRGDDEEENERPARSTRSRPTDDDDEEESPPLRSRSRLSRELDDEVPSDAGRRGERSNGRADDEKPQGTRSRPSRAVLDDDDEEEERRPARTRSRRTDDDEDGEKDLSERRERVRQTLNRE